MKRPALGARRDHRRGLAGVAHPQPDGGGTHHPRRAARHARRREGAIVNIGSANAFLPDPAVMDYSAAKAALANFSKSLSKVRLSLGPR